MSSTFGVFMSYCRQEGAGKAIDEALGQIEEYKDNPDMDMSDSEVKAFRKYIRHIYDWMCDMYLIDGEGAFDDCELDNVCLELKGEWYKGDE